MTFDRRKYQREYARRKREAKLAEKLRTAQRCPHRHGTRACNGPLRTGIDRIGRTIIVCDYCERRKAGICRDCPKPVYGEVRKAVRCESCAKRARARQLRASHARNREDINARARERLAAMPPERKQQEYDYKRAWRKANPEKVAEQKRRYAKKHGSDKRSRYLEYHRRYNAQNARARRKREQALAAYYRDNPVRPDPHCVKCNASIEWKPLPGGRSGRPPKTCDNCCSKYELARRIERREAAANRQPAPIVRPLVRPIKVKHPMPARYAPSGERLCLTPGCDIVVTHKRKKCSKCREKTAIAARERLRLGKYALSQERAA